ncbi:hypothetical protein B0T24DRAFT_591891 [Lasiosphaeria ovina]|uniref:Uncharacterized protein n=1 Tax=Lasiosphaeria ovina TaxID=92902 RepID=A0AAE0N9Y0_9PEZI|nr:hypothetical protein B0T24DRAFT_591891 [Lasiosphaeria ovina]
MAIGAGKSPSELKNSGEIDASTKHIQNERSEIMSKTAHRFPRHLRDPRLVAPLVRRLHGTAFATSRGTQIFRFSLPDVRKRAKENDTNEIRDRARDWAQSPAPVSSVHEATSKLKKEAYQLLMDKIAPYLGDNNCFTGMDITGQRAVEHGHIV